MKALAIIYSSSKGTQMAKVLSWHQYEKFRDNLSVLNSWLPLVYFSTPILNLFPLTSHII